jgi:lipoprotein-anchoring transpeptidase ErfK/SrfK
MVDYYAILLRAVTGPDAGDAQWRHGVFERARGMLAKELRTRQPPLSQAEIAAQVSAMDAAIKRIESEMAWTERGPDTRADDISDLTQAMPERQAVAKPLPAGGTRWIVLAVVVAALGAGGYVVWHGKSQKPAPVAAKSQTASAPPPPVAASAPGKDGDLAPGVDGGNSDVDLPYVYRRQPTFYRTPQPVGTIIIDKTQHFLYLIQKNNVALRYGIGIGDECKDLAGLRHIAGKAEWPPWSAPPNLVKRSPTVLPGGAGNPLGARLLTLDDKTSRINGTNAPKTIGTTVSLGCIRMVNDDIADLYNRVDVNTPVVVN